MSQLIDHARMLSIGTKLFQAAGAPQADAETATEALVQSSLMGHDSHGVMRIPEYLGFIDDGSLITGVPIEVTSTGPSTAVVDCCYNFGAVGGLRAIEAGIDLAREHQTTCVITRRCNHVGRLGAYVQLAAEQGMVAIATCNSPRNGHFVLPWGGRQGRLATNPIAYGVPTSRDPIVADFSTSVAPEGKIRFYRNQTESLPSGWILDAEGQPTTDPDDFYGPPRGGILPLGGAAGHKGYALGLLVELFGSVLGGISSLDAEVRGNGVCFIVVDPSAFVPLDLFRRLASETVEYMKSSEPSPGISEVLVPGELEFKTRAERLATGIPVDDTTWQSVVDWSRQLGVDLPD